MDMKHVNHNIYTCIETKQYNIVDEFIQKHSLNKILELKNKSLLSLILLYAIKINDNDMIKKIEPYITMKRDYLNLLVYYKNNNCNDIVLEEIFKKIDKKLFLSKDIEFLIENKLHSLITLLEGEFITLDTCNSMTPEIINSEHKLLKFYPKSYPNYSIIIPKIEYDYIIDAGNILHSRNGIINNNSINDLKYVINYFPNSLVIIHQRHLKNIDIKNIIKNVKYIKTPFLINDDIYIICAYINNMNAKIISNDKFKDHANNNNNFLCHIIDNTINYTNINGKISFSKDIKYTHCIQVINNNIYIPTKNNEFYIVDNKNNI
jgi:hypothetical protein